MCRYGSDGLLVCPCLGPVEVQSVGALDLGHDALAPELASVTARYAAPAAFGKVAVLLSELLPVSGRRPPNGPVVVGFDGGCVRNRHRQEERHFEVIAGKVIDADVPSTASPSPQWPGGLGRSVRAGVPQPGCALTRRQSCCAMVMLGCGACGARRCRRLPSCSIGGTSPFVLSTRCRRRAASARAWPTQILRIRQFITGSGRNGACGTVAGRGVGVSLLAYSAGRSASTYTG
jgi:hypothetical protein